MPHKNPATERIGGPGASHENRQHPEKSKTHHPQHDFYYERSAVSGGGGEYDAHHAHDPALKGKGRPKKPQ
jgi:hypothetical protein